MEHNTMEEFRSVELPQTFIPYAGISIIQLLQEHIFQWLSTGHKINYWQADETS